MEEVGGTLVQNFSWEGDRGGERREAENPKRSYAMGIRFTKAPLTPQFAPFSRWALGHISYMYTKSRRLVGERKGGGSHALTRLDYIDLFDFIPRRLASAQLSALCRGGQTTISILALFSGYAIVCNDILDARAQFCFGLVE